MVLGREELAHSAPWILAAQKPERGGGGKGRVSRILGTCLLGGEVDLASHVVSGAKVKVVGVVCRGQDVPVVAEC